MIFFCNPKQKKKKLLKSLSIKYEPPHIPIYFLAFISFLILDCPSSRACPQPSKVRRSCSCCGYCFCCCRYP
jgi:hypothetical protein